MSVIVDLLEEGRQRTLNLLAPFDDEFLRAQHSPIMSPLVWDLAHVGNYEDLWLVRALGGDAVGPEHDDLYDAFRHPRPDRPSLPLLSPAHARSYLDHVRERAIALLDRDGPSFETPLLADGFVYGMVIQHEHQHDETMLATIQLSGVRCDLGGGPRAVHGARTMQFVPGGTYTVGTHSEPWAYDNERPSYEVELMPFFIDNAPVTNGEYARFVADGGYDDERLWNVEGWRWRNEHHALRPEFWCEDGSVLRFGTRVPIDPDEPVQHVCWFEADAYARWAGLRLPTEVEWEAADPSHTGQVWEWTSSAFAPWPGFASFPYREYSEVFYGDGYRVLRGASWATHDTVKRRTFRNWDLPIRRQIFAGFRCARDT